MILMDVLPTLGNKASLMYVKSLIVDGSLRGERLAQILATLPLNTVPKTEYISTVMVSVTERKSMLTKYKNYDCRLYSTVPELLATWPNTIWD